jgi:cytochrome c oxidase subunit 2
MLHPVGQVAVKQVGLFTFTLWLSLGVSIAVFGTLAYALIRFRRRKTDKGIPRQVHGSVLVEAIWTAIPVVIVIMIAVPTVQTIWATESRIIPNEDDININVMGFQWWWEFEYPELGIVTANELHVPEGRRMVFSLDSADVLHSFWAPKLGGKRDLIPGQDNELWLISDQTGEFWGHCAELCLGAHAYMRFRIIVDTEEDYQAWVESFQQVQAPELLAEGVTVNVQQPATDPQIALGKQLVAQKGCIGCHSIAGYLEGASTGSRNYPDLTNFGLRNTVGAAVLPNTPENLARWLRDPQEVKPGNYMPTLWSDEDPNREEEISAIVAYLLSLGKPAEDSAQAVALNGGTNGYQ